MTYNHDCRELVRQLGNKDVLVEFVLHSPTSQSEGAFAKGRLNSGVPVHSGNISIKLFITNSEIQVPYQDIKLITLLNIYR